MSTKRRKKPPRTSSAPRPSPCPALPLDSCPSRCIPNETASATHLGARHAQLSVLRSALAIVHWFFWPLGSVFSSKNVFSLLLAVGLGLGLVVVSIGCFQSLLGSMMAGFLNRSMLVLPPLMSLVYNATVPLGSWHCAIVQTRYCQKRHSDRLAGISRTVASTARKASDIFDSVIQLSSPSDLGLHQTEIWELGFAVKYSTELDTKDSLAEQLANLGDLTRDVKDQMVDLNSEGINAFSSIVHEFSRMSDLIYMVQSGNKQYDSSTISKNLDLLFDNLSVELSRLVDSVERLLPLASRSSNLGARVFESLHRENSKLRKIRAEQPLWRKLLEPLNSSPTGRQLSDDIALTSQSIQNLKQTWQNLENVRTDLRNYWNNVAYFKASLVGWHMADHGLTAEDELYTLRFIISDFKTTIARVKSSDSKVHDGMKMLP